MHIVRNSYNKYHLCSGHHTTIYKIRTPYAESLPLCYNLIILAAKCHHLLVETYDDSYLLIKRCRDWYQRFRDGNYNLSEKQRKKMLQQVRGS